MNWMDGQMICEGMLLHLSDIFYFLALAMHDKCHLVSYYQRKCRHLISPKTGQLTPKNTSWTFDHRVMWPY